MFSSSYHNVIKVITGFEEFKSLVIENKRVIIDFLLTAVHTYSNRDATEEITPAFLGSSKTVLGFLDGHFTKMTMDNIN